jgi:hypothetical protein
MRSFDELRTEILALFDRAEALAGPAGAGPETIRRLALARQRLESGQLTTAVCGEFKRGKSTLLGALLDDPELFPSDTLPGTNSVTTVRFAETEAVIVTVELPDRSMQRSPITRAEIADYVTERGNPGNQRKVLAVEIETPNPKLASGLAFVDTPGVGGVFAEHTVVTLAFLPGADALIFVTDVEAPLLASELAFLRRAVDAANLADDANSLVCVMTKIDEGTEYEDLYAEDLAELAKLAGRPATDMVLIPVSSWQKLDFLRSGDQTALANSNFAALEDALWAALGRRRVRVLLGGALRAVRELFQGLLAPIDAAQLAGQDKTGARLTELEDEAQQRRDALAMLANDTGGWIKDLNGELKTAQERLEVLASGELEKNWGRFLTEYLHDDWLLGNLEELRAQADADMATLHGAVLKLVRAEVAAAMERFSSAKHFSLTPPHITDLPDLPPPEITGDLSALKRGRDDGGSLVWRTTSVGVGLGTTAGGAAGAAAGAVIGGILGTFIFPGAGTLAGAGVGAQLGAALLGVVGGGVGGVLGHKGGQQTRAARDADSLRAELVRLFNSHKTAQKEYLRGLVKQAVDEARPLVIAELKSRLAQQRETINHILRRLAEERRAVQAGQAADDAKLASERKPLDDLLHQVDGLGKEADLLAGPSGQAAAPA